MAGEVSPGPAGPVLWNVQAKSVPREDTGGTVEALSGHFLDTPERGARRVRQTLPGALGPEGPERLL